MGSIQGLGFSGFTGVIEFIMRVYTAGRLRAPRVVLGFRV